MASFPEVYPRDENLGKWLAPGEKWLILNDFRGIGLITSML